ncbi:ribonucleoside-diphosphate reductase subunit alpha [Halorubrum aidingense JCM 13560]|uniref:Ribonucleoside-diphosphate reductase n=1 Tax=Halorubrum aidingense JCM 13560 TaxID=1230454 RepID=M0P7K1_9EURY|nr:ribonucleoside-diphosphate reductase subunit alpha [Halorubrum aidingense]EMA65991.1 ribonucleoside-diphosphate reductase subunit alpha [Halorubrum aidingense JCM 13560]
MSTTTHDTAIRDLLDRARAGYEDVLDEAERDRITAEVERALYDGADRDEIAEATIDALTARIERDPAYDSAAARVARGDYVRRVTGERPPDGGEALAEAYRESFRAAIDRGLDAGLLDERMGEYDLDRLAEAIVPERDELFDYTALDTLEQRYYLREADSEPFELPQVFWMRVAMGVALREDRSEREARAEEFYEVLSTLRFVHSTPTLFHAGTTHPQLSSCYLTTVPDDLEGIFDAYKEHAKLSKWSGGLGNDWTPLRADGALVSSTGVESTGTVPFLKIANDVTGAINRSGKRRGAAAAYLEAWHLDFPAFIDLRRNTGDERRRTHDMNTAAWVPDLLMKRVENDEEWTLFSPDEVPDLHGAYGEEFETLYEEYEEAAANGELRQYETVDASDLWRETLTRLFETGHPWITFKDPCNVRSPQDHVGVVNSSNLCTEITLNTSEDETAVCNLGSINLARHMTFRGDAESHPAPDDVAVAARSGTEDGRLDSPVNRGADGEAAELDAELFADTAETAMRMLDNVVDLNFYPTEKAERSNMRHRPIGLGMMGFHEALQLARVPMNSERALGFAGKAGELLGYHALDNSAKLAAERGAYETFEGSKWDRDLLPQDTLDLLADERGREVPVDREETLDWDAVRDRIADHGMRNSNTTAVAPTATISTIAGTSASIEPQYSNLYVRSNMSGDFTVVNERLVADLKAEGQWGSEALDRLKYRDGAVGDLDLPGSLSDLYRGAFEIDPRHQLRLTARRGAWIDQSQSHNVFFPSTDGSLLSDVYETAWELGLKTTYYLRTLGASSIEQSTLDMSQYDDTQSRGGTRNAADDADLDDGSGSVPAESGSADEVGGDLPTVEDPTCDACQ